ncbi:MAG: hypothetical protein SX243_16420 [Acidobacteriota bacterium]|nr:hypothetical protein [Acidobacteriota bacterium]
MPNLVAVATWGVALSGGFLVLLLAWRNPSSRRTGVSWWLGQLSPFLLLSAVSLALWLGWGTIPEHIPIRWSDFGDSAGSWPSKSLPVVLFRPLVGATMCGALMLLQALAFSGSKLDQQESPQQAPGVSGGLFWTLRMGVAAAASMVALLPLIHDPDRSRLLLILVLVGSLIGLPLILILQLAQAGLLTARRGTGVSKGVEDNWRQAASHDHTQRTLASELSFVFMGAQSLLSSPGSFLLAVMLFAIPMLMVMLFALML